MILVLLRIHGQLNNMAHTIQYRHVCFFTRVTYDNSRMIFTHTSKIPVSYADFFDLSRWRKPDGIIRLAHGHMARAGTISPSCTCSALELDLIVTGS